MSYRRFRLGAFCLVMSLAIGTAVSSRALPLIPDASDQTGGEWVAGDLHIHTIWGHDTCITPNEKWDNTKPDFNARKACSEPWTWGFAPGDRIAEAEDRGLDFAAITDHNNVMTSRDPAVTGYAGDLLIIPAYENSLAGHVQMIGTAKCYNNLGPVETPIVECHKLVTDQSPSGMTQLADAIRANGGLFQVNHPSSGNWSAAFGTSVVPDSIEVWNIGAWFYQPPNLASNDNDYSLSYWDRFLREGHKVAATGGSDSHWRSTDLVQGIGEPTTWVWVTDRSVAGIIAGIRAGRTTISTEPPARQGPRVWLEADADNDGRFESMVGDSVPAGTRFRVRTSNVAPGSVLRIVDENGYRELRITNSTQEFMSSASKFVRVEVRLPDAQDERVANCDAIAREITDESGGEVPITECRNRLVMEALSSPIYIQ